MFASKISAPAAVARIASRGYATQSGSGRVFLVSGKRTPFGKFGESLRDQSPVDLATHATKAVLADTKLDPARIDHVIVGNVINTTTDTMYCARHVALRSGMPLETPAYNLNRLCGSGIQAIGDALTQIEIGRAQAVIAAGTENMSNVPHLTYGARFGTKYGNLTSVDMLLDALTDKFANLPMGITAEKLGAKYNVTRLECDEFSMQSHEKAAKAYADNNLQGEIAPVTLKKGEISRDEHIREKTSLADMAKLKPSFQKDGLVTPGSASGIVDGAASVLIASEEFCQRHGLTPLAQVVDYVPVGVDPSIMGIGPVPAIRKLLERTGLKFSDIDLFEINEAFAAQTIACAKELSLPMDRLNIWGGATAIGHPLGATGVRITLTLARQLQKKNAKLGIASACIGGGQGIAVLLKAV
eukprot:TRINITY_DN8723_c0_g1_i1.p1 TRINITY_DN8723_c0_g1~~TRINITY_DN8723_c0_g1_i1.p1  ORF type:complete len:448 (-),score=157.24 TRINITY_DN8723_c0_g1_i1:123-1364(-)